MYLPGVSLVLVKENREDIRRKVLNLDVQGQRLRVISRSPFTQI